MKPLRKMPPRARRASVPLPDSVVVALPADCTLGNIGALRDLLCEVKAGVPNITLDLRRLERFDTATLQLLAAFTRDHAARGANLLTCGNRPAWDEAAALLGLTATLEGRV
ncbi:MAG TPA: STAS domain-containing protein [Steroidobacteraceae bacterium]|nr:STAS domain-containing protein [Steroidobacteraceae bacterium]